MNQHPGNCVCATCLATKPTAPSAPLAQRIGTVAAFERAFAAFLAVHPGRSAATVTLREFSTWFVGHAFYAHGSSKVMCEACGLLWESHQPPSSPRMPAVVLPSLMSKP
jgi:hypothetical protein